MSKKSSITFRIMSPDGAVTESSSDLESVIIGSGAGATVKLSDPKVSNLHAMFKVEKSGGVTVMDLGSEHGTSIKDQRIKDSVTLSSGDVLDLGSSKVTVIFGDVPASEAKTELNGMPTNGAANHVAAVAAPKLPPTPRPSAPKELKPAPVPPRGLAGTGKNAATLFNEPLAPEATPAEDSKVLQVALLWGDTLISIQHFADGVPVTIGDGPSTKFAVFSSGVGPSSALAQAKGSTAPVNVPAEAGLIVLDAQRPSHKSKEYSRRARSAKLRAAEGGLRADAIELGLHDRAQVSLENVAFIVRYVRPSARISVNTLEEADFTFFKIASICLMAFIALVLAMILTPIGIGGEGDDIFQNPAKYVKMIVRPEKEKARSRKLDLSGLKEGKKPKDEEGKFGKKDEKKDKAVTFLKKGAPIVDANKREEDRKKVMKAGLLGALGDGAASNVFGPGGLGTGINNALGGLTGGAGQGDAHGVGGMGSRGTGPGGGGTGLGLGGLGTKGSGRGLGGNGSIDLGGRGKDSVRIVPGKTTVKGGLSKDVIMKVIKRHQNEIKFCYEQEAQKNPDLAGKVAVAFTIDPAGAVADATVAETTLNNGNAENCMLSRIRRWKFPEPEGGGVVEVNFPWVFKVAGGADDGE